MKKNAFNAIALAVVLIIALAQFLGESLRTNSPATDTPTAPPATAATTDVFARAFAERQNDLQVRGEGQVKKILADDNDGSRHQRFILELDSGQTLLVAHNIDLAPRIDKLRPGDTVEFFGEYEWTRQGGVIHWTHHDPRGRHAAGWLRHKGRTYD